MPTLNAHLYCLTFPDGKRYFGMTFMVRKRMNEHRQWAKTKSAPINQAIKKYGLPPCQVLCIGRRAYIADLEEKMTRMFQTHLPEFGYNGWIGNNRGNKRTAQHRANIKDALAKSAKFQAVKQRLAGWNKGIPHTPEHKAKIAAKLKGRYFSPEHRAKISAAKRK